MSISSFDSISISGTVWFASDMHLSADSPATNKKFIEFLEYAATKANALLLIGDIFDAWIGDDYAKKAPHDWIKPILKALQSCAQKLDLYLMRGNRDFLMGPNLADLLGAQILPDVVLLESDYGCILVSHGDEYCTADKNFQKLRRITKSRLFQFVFLRLSLKTRIKIAKWARGRSEQSHKYKSIEIMDVTEQSVIEAFVQTNCKTMVHGHTHRPNIHNITIDNNSYKRIVLTDWDFDSPSSRGGWLSLSKEGFKLNYYPDLV